MSEHHHGEGHGHEGRRDNHFTDVEARVKALETVLTSVLAEFGLELPAGKKIRVWDSTAELRYLVVPERPPGTESLPRGRPRRVGHPRLHDRHRASPARPKRGRQRLLRVPGGRAQPTGDRAFHHVRSRTHRTHPKLAARSRCDAARQADRSQERSAGVRRSTASAAIGPVPRLPDVPDVPDPHRP